MRGARRACTSSSSGSRPRVSNSGGGCSSWGRCRVRQGCAESSCARPICTSDARLQCDAMRCDAPCLSCPVWSFFGRLVHPPPRVHLGLSLSLSPPTRVRHPSRNTQSIAESTHSDELYRVEDLARQQERPPLLWRPRGWVGPTTAGADRRRADTAWMHGCTMHNSHQPRGGDNLAVWRWVGVLVVVVVGVVVAGRAGLTLPPPTCTQSAAWAQRAERAIHRSRYSQATQSTSASIPSVRLMLLLQPGSGRRRRLDGWMETRFLTLSCSLCSPALCWLHPLSFP